ncbi:MAG: hypothetical protein HUU41_22915 [Bryobacteraceae bacterium]|nr:hypothetical protein [Bryobacteraceae bacterium]
MAKWSGSFSRDASNRLSFEMFDVDALDYPRLAARVVEHFDLTPSSELIVGLDEMFRDYSDGACTVGLEWDNWSGFIVVAKTQNAEPLVEAIGAYLSDG